MVRSFLVYIILFIASICGASAQQGTVESRLELTSPKPEKVEWGTSKENAITILILATDTAWFCYWDSIPSRGSIYDMHEMDRMIKTFSEQKDTSYFLIKTDANSSYKATVDILDKMTEYKIKHFAIVKMNDAEKYIATNGGDLELMVPLEVEQPTTANKTIYPTEYAFYIQIKKDGSIWYKPDVGYNKDNFTKLDTTKKEILAAEIGRYKKNRDSLNKKDHYIILGDNESKFTAFEFVIEALRKNEVYKYNLITEESQ